MFKNRTEAGLLLAEKLKNYSNIKDVIVVTIPRGGLPLGYTIATQLHAPLEIVLSKKIGHPANKEYAIGAVTHNDRILSVNSDSISEDYLIEETNKQVQTGEFGAMMKVELVNDGPVTIMIDSKNRE